MYKSIICTLKGYIIFVGLEGKVKKRYRIEKIKMKRKLYRPVWMDPGGPCERPLRCTVPGPLPKRQWTPYWPNDRRD